MASDDAWSLTARRLESARLTLGPLRVGHAEEPAPVLDDVALHQFTGGEPASAQDLRARLERQTRGRPPDGSDCWLNWLVHQRTTGRAIGGAQATIKASKHAVIAELAWVIGTRYQRQGFAKEANGIVCDWQTSQRVDRLQAHIHPWHDASLAVARSVELLPTQTIVHGERDSRSSVPTNHD